MINFDDIAREKIKKYNQKWLQTSDHPYRILITGGSGRGKTNTLFNVVSQLSNADKIYLYAKDPLEAKKNLLISKGKNVCFERNNDSKALIYLF